MLGNSEFISLLLGGMVHLRREVRQENAAEGVYSPSGTLGFGGRQACCNPYLKTVKMTGLILNGKRMKRVLQVCLGCRGLLKSTTENCYRCVCSGWYWSKPFYEDMEVPLQCNRQLEHLVLGQKNEANTESLNGL